jgi:hypothetical protein
MKNKKLRFMVLFLTIGCFLAISCGGGGSSDGVAPSPPPESLSYSTGDQDFNVTKARQMDPLGDFSTEGSVGASPSRVDHSTLMPKPKPQGNTGSCTAWANGYYMKSYQEAQEEGWDVNENAFSPGYLFAMQCRTYGEFKYNDSPFTSPYSSLVSYAVLSKYGCAKWNTMPYVDLGLGDNRKKQEQAYADLEIPEGADDEARNYRCNGFTFEETLSQVKQALTQGPVVVSINHYDTPQLHPAPEENYLRYNSQNDKVGHAIALVGYDDAKFGTGALKFINSWGEGWAEKGFSWIRYTDYGNIVRAAIRYNDLPNPNHPDNPANEDKLPDPPSDVEASDDIGNYVDVSWSPVSGATSYRIYRSEVENHNGYEQIGSAHQGNYRDYPTPGVAYYYAVVAVNDLGESDLYGGDKDAKGYIDIGSAIGGSRLTTPTLTWSSNDEEGSSFSVADIDPAATSMEVQVSKYNTGPWESLGWIKPEDFKIKWADDSEYTNRQPYVRLRVTSADASSDFSEPVHVGEDIPTDIEVGALSNVEIDVRESSMLLRWIPVGNIDYVEIWRYCASNDTESDWVKLGYCNSGEPDQYGFINCEDTTPKPGIPYYYGLIPVYQGAYGKSYVTDKPYKVEATKPNLALVDFQYEWGWISSNTTEFNNIVVRNDGSTDVPSYTIGIYAKSWLDGSVHSLGRWSVNTTLAAGDQQYWKIPVTIPVEFADGIIYSWGIKVDDDNSIPEVYESDNTRWSTYGWLLTLDFSANAVRSKSQVQTESGDSNGDDMVMIYNGPAIFEKPEL